ncbi:ferrochelatase [Calycomorphotria hydatis]|uniref:Ferrochelatase n=1 Tax=Calycomorphotria hydatis TaxID=2528027 RepID=A0A517T9A8_9PLAN|nr:ferrochelatase [Calycomorphotria hydatis]QDT64956.1 Ferrochelatase [Calycomorphotria hydatis]
MADYDAVLVVSFGGPEKKEDVIPFLENVLRGRNVPRERMLEVAEHYYHFDGYSPLNDQVRELLEKLREDFESAGTELPIYWGNRNWHPMLADTIRQMRDDGVKKGLALVLSSYSCYSGCRQYREDVYRACEEVGEGAPQFDKVRVWYNHPLFIEANADKVQTAIDQLPNGANEQFHIAYTAHSIPSSMAETSDYVKQLSETCRLTSEAVGVPENRWRLVYQSRSGRPQDPWLEPDICDHLKALYNDGIRHCVVMPIGFLSDHMEVLYDLDDEARKLADELGMTMQRAQTVGTDARFVSMLRELVEERLEEESDRSAIGKFGPNHDICPENCCPAPIRRRPVTGNARPSNEN